MEREKREKEMVATLPSFIFHLLSSPNDDGGVRFEVIYFILFYFFYFPLD